MMYKHLVDPRLRRGVWRSEFRTRAAVSRRRREAVRASRLAMKTKSPSSGAFAAARPYAAAGSTSSTVPRTTSDCLSLRADLVRLPGLKGVGECPDESQALHDSKP
jgi:hypothetical protein